jgi:hypothetical protein
LIVRLSFRLSSATADQTVGCLPRASGQRR